MNRFLIAPLGCALLVACVQVPEGNSGAPTVELMLGSPKAYPGSSVEVQVIASDDTASAEQLTYEWSSSNDGIVFESSNESSAIFSVGVGVEANQEVVLTAKVSDPDRNRTEKSITVEIDNEPFVIVDGQTDGSSDSDIKPLFLTGIYSGKQVNLKANDVRSSENYEISVSPDGRFVFYTQLFINAQWQARLFDALTGLNYRVALDYSTVDSDAIVSFWSGDSQYLAIKAPQQDRSLSDQDLLYWLDLDQLSLDETLLTPASKELPFDRLIWSDNSTALNEQAYAALFSGNELKVLDPSAEEPLSTVMNDAGNAFVYLNAASGNWTTNQLFFMATVAVPSGDSTTNVQHLFRWSPELATTDRLSGTTTTPVVSYDSYVATQVAFHQGTTLKLHDGNTAANIQLTGSSTVTTGEFDYQWSPDGQRLGVMTLPTNSGNSGSWVLHSWASANKRTVPVDWDSAAVDTNIAAWQWNQNRTSMTVLSHDGIGLQDTIYIVDGESDDSAVEVVGGIFTSERGEANGSMLALESSLVRSPNGEWQLYWGYDRTNSSPHMDIWALHTGTKAWKNLSRLMSEYETPTSAGVFEPAEGFDVTNPVYAGKTLYWVSNSELVFSVNSVEVSDDYLDLRYVNLNSESSPKSILLRREILSEIERIQLPQSMNK